MSVANMKENETVKDALKGVLTDVMPMPMPWGPLEPLSCVVPSNINSSVPM